MTTFEFHTDDGGWTELTLEHLPAVGQEILRHMHDRTKREYIVTRVVQAIADHKKKPPSVPGG